MTHEIGQCIANFLRVDRREVDLVRDTIKPEFDGLLGDRAVKVVDELHRDLLCHPTFPFIRRHPLFAREYTDGARVTKNVANSVHRIARTAVDTNHEFILLLAVNGLVREAARTPVANVSGESDPRRKSRLNTATAAGDALLRPL